MANGITSIDIDEIQALIRMTQHGEPFVANIAKATLAVVETRRDAEIRAAIAEAALEAAEARIAALRQVVAAHDGSDPDEILRQVAQLLI